jgi:hypothetical protein
MPGNLRLPGRALVALTLIAMVRSQIWISGDGASGTAPLGAEEKNLLG